MPATKQLIAIRFSSSLPHDQSFAVPENSTSLSSAMASGTPSSSSVPAVMPVSFSKNGSTGTADPWRSTGRMWTRSVSMIAKSPSIPSLTAPICTTIGSGS